MENLDSLGSFDPKKLIQEIQERLNKELKGAEKRISKSSNGSFRTEISESSNIDGTLEGMEDAVKPNELGRKVVSALLKDYEESMLFHLSPLLTVSNDQLFEGRLKSRKQVFENLAQISEEQDLDSEEVKTELNEILSAQEEFYSKEIITRNLNVKKLIESALTDFQQRLDTAIDAWILDFTTIIPSYQPSLFISRTQDNEEKSPHRPSPLLLEFINCNVNQKSDSASLYWNTMSEVLQSHVLLGMPSKYHKEFKTLIEKDTAKIQEILFQLQTSFTTYERYMTSRFETHLCLSTEYFNKCHQAAWELCLQTLQGNSKYVIQLQKGVDNYKKQFEVRNRLISENCKKVAEQTIPSVKKFYVDLLTNFVKDEAVQRDELQKLHKEVVKECLRGFTKACDFHPNSGIRSYEAELRTELELQRQTFEMSNNRRILKILQQTNDSIEYHRKLYNEKMNLFMAKEDIEVSELEIFNESKQKEVCSLLEQKIDEDKGNNRHFVSRDQAEKKLKKQIEDDWECLKELNRTKTMRRALESAQKELESQESLVQMRLKERKLADYTQSIARDNEPHISPSVSADSSDQKYNMLLSQEFDEQIQMEVQCIRTKYFAAIHKVKYEFELQSVHDHELEQATNTLRQFLNKLVDDSTKQQHVKQLEKGLQLELDRKRSMIRKAEKEFPISESSPANANVFRQGIKIDRRKKTKSKSQDNKASPLPGNQPLKQDDANQENEVVAQSKSHPVAIKAPQNPTETDEPQSTNSFGCKMVALLMSEYEQLMSKHLSPLLIVSDQQLNEGLAKSRKLVLENLAILCKREKMDDEKVKTMFGNMITTREELYRIETNDKNSKPKELVEIALTDYRRQFEMTIESWVLQYTNLNKKQKSDCASFHRSILNQVLQSYYPNDIQHRKQFQALMENGTAETFKVLMELQNCFVAYEMYMNKRLEMYKCVSEDELKEWHQKGMESCLKQLNDDGTFVNKHFEAGINNYKRQFRKQNIRISAEEKEAAPEESKDDREQKKLEAERKLNEQGHELKKKTEAKKSLVNSETLTPVSDQPKLPVPATIVHNFEEPKPRDRILPPIAIEFGLHKIRVGWIHENKFEIINNSWDEDQTLNQIALTVENEVLIGKEVDGRPSSLLLRFYFKLEEVLNDPRDHEAVYECNLDEDRYLRKEFLIGLVLARIKSDTEKQLRGKWTTAVITVPLWYNSIQRQATKDASLIAGFSEVHLINETSAAALAMSISATGENRCSARFNKYILVTVASDFHFDTAVYNYGSGNVEMESSRGDLHCHTVPLLLKTIKSVKKFYDFQTPSSLDSVFKDLVGVKKDLIKKSVFIDIGNPKERPEYYEALKNVTSKYGEPYDRNRAAELIITGTAIFARGLHCSGESFAKSLIKDKATYTFQRRVGKTTSPLFEPYQALVSSEVQGTRTVGVNKSYGGASIQVEEVSGENIFPVGELQVQVEASVREFHLKAFLTYESIFRAEAFLSKGKELRPVPFKFNTSLLNDTQKGKYASLVESLKKDEKNETLEKSKKQLTTLIKDVWPKVPFVKSMIGRGQLENTVGEAVAVVQHPKSTQEMVDIKIEILTRLKSKYINDNYSAS